MPRFTVQKSVTIAAPIEKVFSLVQDFQKWPTWSPWLKIEPDCSLDFADDGQSYSWDGQIIGSGTIQKVTEKDSESIDLKLSILKPWKAQSDVHFDFEENSEGTRVTWTLHGSLPFFMFFLKSMMTCLIGMDYERGLRMLKDFAESGNVPSSLEMCGRQSISSITYIGIPNTCSMDTMPIEMEKDFQQLSSWMKEHNIRSAGPPFSIYSKWQITKGECSYIIASPVNEPPSASLPDRFVSDTRPDCEAYMISHTGAYRHLGNAWSAGMQHTRAQKMKQSKSVMPFEVYINDPTDTQEEDLITQIYFPMKA